jgi:hypothetical protein
MLVKVERGCFSPSTLTSLLTCLLTSDLTKRATHEQPMPCCMCWCNVQHATLWATCESNFPLTLFTIFYFTIFPTLFSDSDFTTVHNL